MIDHNKRSVYKCVLLYPDNEAHVQALHIIETTWTYSGILHDKDVDVDGKIKKPHWHIIIKLNSTQTDYYVAEAIGIDVYYIEPVKSVKSAYNYLTHKFEENKHKYKDNELFGDFVFTDDSVDNNRFNDFIELIKKYDIKKPKQLVQLAIDNNYVDVLKKNSYLLLQIIKNY